MTSWYWPASNNRRTSAGILREGDRRERATSANAIVFISVTC